MVPQVCYKFTAPLLVLGACHAGQPDVAGAWDATLVHGMLISEHGN